MAINKFIVQVSVLFLSLTANADDVPNTFQAGEPIVASEVNENFSDLQNQINTLKAQLESQSNTENVRSFVGITIEKTTGNTGGQYFLDQMCETEYTNSKACKSDEVESVNPNLLQNKAYLIAKVREYTAYDQAFYHGIDTILTPRNWNCNNWTTAGPAYNFQLKENGSINHFYGCGEDLSVACCR